MKLTLRRPALSLPLLAKELVESANRRRTYAIRTAYAVLLFSAALLMLYNMMETSGSVGNPLYILGRGRELFEMLVALQFAGIYLFLPALVSGAITSEKEANSLQLLLITDMRPWEILLSKLGGRLVPMATFLLLGMPLLAVAYAFGGVTAESLAAAVTLLAAATFQVGAFCLMVSAWCSTTSSAFIACYLLGLAVYFGPIILYGILHEFFHVRFFIDDPVLWHIPIAAYFMVNPQYGTPPTYPQILLAATPSIATGLVFLGVARAVFVRRALLPPRSALRSLFTFFDTVFERANRVTGGVVLIKDRDSLPGDRPVTWLEIHQRALSKARYLIRIFVLLEAPVFIVLTMMLAFESQRGSAEGLSAVLFFVFPLAGLMACVQAAGSFAAERRRQTLEVLLTTPMTGREIVKQKMAAIWRLLLVLAAPLVTVVVLEAWWEHGSSHSEWDSGLQRSILWNGGLVDTFGYLLTSFLAIFIYLPLVAYLCLYIGMRVKHATRAILTAVAAVIGWVAFLPMLVALVGDTFFRGPDHYWMWFLLLSPASIVPFVEFNDLDQFTHAEWVPVVLNFAFHGGLLALFRAGCLHQADRLLGRV